MVNIGYILNFIKYIENSHFIQYATNCTNWSNKLQKLPIYYSHTLPPLGRSATSGLVAPLPRIAFSFLIFECWQLCNNSLLKWRIVAGLAWMSKMQFGLPVIFCSKVYWTNYWTGKFNWVVVLVDHPDVIRICINYLKCLKVHKKQSFETSFRISSY